MMSKFGDRETCLPDILPPEADATDPAATNAAFCVGPSMSVIGPTVSDETAWTIAVSPPRAEMLLAAWGRLELADATASSMVVWLWILRNLLGGVTTYVPMTRLLGAAPADGRRDAMANGEVVDFVYLGLLGSAYQSEV